MNGERKKAAVDLGGQFEAGALQSAYNLEQAGYAVSVAHDGQDGLNQAQSKSPDVIVLDHHLGAEDLPPAAEMYRALLRRDAAYEGVFYLGVRTTGIFCRPTCTAKKPRPGFAT